MPARRVNRAPPKLPLYDPFAVDLAAGAVNGTLAPTGQTRVVSGDLSISGGRLVLAASAGLWYDQAMTRTVGRLLRAVLNVTDVTNTVDFGFDTDKTGVIAGTAVRIGADTVRIYNGSGIGQRIAVLSDGVSYEYALALRATGAVIMRRLLTESTWTLLWLGGVDNDATLYAALVNTDAAGWADDVLIPRAPWLPTPVASDGCSVRATTDGLGHAEGIAGGIGAGGGGVAWLGGNTWTVAAGAALNTPTLGAELATGTLTVGARYSITATEANHFYTGCAIGHTFRAAAATALDANNKVKPLALSELLDLLPGPAGARVAAKVMARNAYTQVGVAFRWDSQANPQNGAIAIFDGANMKVSQCVAGVWSDLATVAVTFVAGAEIQVYFDGQTVRLYYNNVKIAADMTLNAGLTGTLHGKFSTHADNTLDDVTVYATTGHNLPR